MRRHIAAWCIAALGLGALAACANQSADSPTAGSSPGTGASAASPVAPSVTPPSLPSAPIPSSKPTPPTHTVKPSPSRSGIIKPIPSGPLTLTGTIYAGAEPSCLLLLQGRVVYLLNAADSWKLRVGQRVIVSGKVAPRGLMSHCMQGTPFLVSNAEVLSPNG